MGLLGRLLTRLNLRSSSDESNEPITCPGCGRPVGTAGDICEHCGATADPKGGLY